MYVMSDSAPKTDSRAAYESWGRYPRVQHRLIQHVNWVDQLPRLLGKAAPESVLPYGLGRSYGDSCLNEGRDLLSCARLNRILGFNGETGLMRCEGGVSLSDILDLCVPRGWFLPVTPGTRFVTVGGAIANDVHGKNHHRAGTFGCHIRRLGLYRSDYGSFECGPLSNQNWFHATVGGLGLTGVIVWAEIQLRPIQGPMINAETIPFRSFDEFLALSNASDDQSEYTVAWIDCFSGSATRGIFFRGNHSMEPGKPSRAVPSHKVPFEFPTWVLNPSTMKLFNSGYNGWSSFRKGPAIVPYGAFFYPLDSIRQWNLLYGKRGFLQYQCVVPENCLPGFKEVLGLIRGAGMGSFLGVMKHFGSDASPGMLSFPRRGLTLALDFPMRGDHTLKLLSELDRVVQDSGGALYPGKDARMSPAMFQTSFPNWRDFRKYVDPKFSSSFWRRVTGGA
jgi:FAD/FMN-containing dehydrogenase